MITVSVIIPCFNASRWIRATIDSVFQQQVGDVEVIVVDDGSTDGSGDLMARAFPTVRLVRIENGGASRARNVGTHLARGQFIQYLDADDLLAPGKLETQLQALAASTADIAYGDWRELRAEPDAPFRLGRLVARRIEGDPQIALLTVFWCPPAAYLFRRAIVDRVGGWDERQPVIEDVRFVLDCALSDAEFLYCPGLAAIYRVHTTQSLSTRDPAAFARGCLRNAVTTEAWWRQSGGLTTAHTTALVGTYAQVARATFATDDETFEAAFAALQRLQPGYRPARPWHLALASRLVGYRGAEAIAVQYRRAKHTLTEALQLADR
jgi:cellulose synthase/poly-beta-1,6-N-acetylglucosamine synthase-like glycosyltransferase